MTPSVISSMVSKPISVAKSIPDRTPRQILTWGLVVVFVIAICGAVYVSITPGTSAQPFTEFYVLGPSGEAEDYPTNLSVNESGQVIVGITNQEQQTLTYTVVLQLDGRTVSQQSLALNDGQTWEREFEFSPTSPGEKQLRILLFTGSAPDSMTDPYRELRLLIQVSPG